METLKELLSIGKQHFDARQYSEAEDYLRRIVERGGRYADVFNMMGLIAHAGGRFQDAMGLFNNALKINPGYTEATLNLAVLYNDLGKYDEARSLYAKIRKSSKPDSLKIEPVLRGKLSNLHADLGDIYRSIGLYSHSIDEYQKALSLNPSYLDIRTKLGQSLRERGKLSESAKELKLVLRSNGKYTAAMVQLGVTYYAMKKIVDARKCWNQALSQDSGNELARMYIKLCDALDNARRKNAELPNRTRRARRNKRSR